MIRKLQAQLLIIILGVLAAAFVLSFLYAKNAVREEVFSQWTTHAQRNGARVESYLEQIKNISLSISANDIYLKYLITPDPALKDKIEKIFLRSISKIDLIEAMRIVDVEGNILIYAKWDKALTVPGSKTVNIASKNYFKTLSLSSSREPLFSNFERGLTPGDKDFGPPMIRMLQPLYDGDKKLGYLLVNFDVTVLDDLLYIMDKGRPYSFIAEYNDGREAREGVFLLHPNKQYEFSDQFDKNYYVKTVFSPRVNDIMKNNLSGVIKNDNSDDYIFFNTIKPYGEERESWKVALVLDGGYFFSGIHILKNSPVVLAAAAVVLSVLLAIIISKQMISPINNINNAIKKFASGDLDYRLKGEFPKELKDIAAAVNHMAGALQERIREIGENHKKIEALNRLGAMSVIAGGMAHELNSPLNSILIACSFLEKNLKDDQKQDLELIRSQVLRCTEIISSLRAISPNRKDSLIKEEADLKYIAEKACSMTEFSRDIRLVKDLENAPALCETTLALTAALNLLKNAGESINGTGTVYVRTFRKNGKSVLEVEDTGCGIDRETLEKLPTPFISTKTCRGNMGIGLCLVYKIMADHEGGVKARSEKNVGTKFALEFPNA